MSHLLSAAAVWYCIVFRSPPLSCLAFAALTTSPALLCVVRSLIWVWIRRTSISCSRDCKPFPPSLFGRCMSSGHVFLGRLPADFTTPLFLESHSRSTVAGMAATCKGNFIAALMTALMQYIAISVVGLVWLILSYRSSNLLLNILVCSLHVRSMLKNTPKYRVAFSMFVECIASNPTHCCSFPAQSSVDSLTSSAVAPPYALTFAALIIAIIVAFLALAASPPSSLSRMSFSHSSMASLILAMSSLLGCFVTGWDLSEFSISRQSPS